MLFIECGNGIAIRNDIDKMICAEIPDVNVDPEYYNVVSEFMIHGSCGVVRKDSPCMANGCCVKYFPKKFVEVSNFDNDGYPLYRRINHGRIVVRKRIELDNRYVLPHNRYLLMKYRAHIYVE